MDQRIDVMEVLIPNDTTFIWDAMEVAFDENDYDGMEEWWPLSIILAKGDNFVIKTREDNVEGMVFYIIMCTNIIFIDESYPLSTQFLFLLVQNLLHPL